jgi:hypothetical protein
MKQLSIMPDMPSATVMDVRGPMRSGRPTSNTVEPLEHAVIKGQHLVFRGFFQEDGLQFLEFFRIRGGEVVGEAEVGAGIIEFPGGIVLQRAARFGFPRRLVNGAGEPALVVDRAVAGDLEVLGRVPLLGLGVVKRIDQTLAFHRHLPRAVHDLGLGQTGRFQHGRRDVNHMAELRADFVLRFDALGPVRHHADARAAEVGRHLLGPLERRVQRHGPTGRHVGIGFGAAPFVHQLDHVFEFLGHAVEVGHFVEHAVHAAFGTGPVVAGDVEDQRVVELANVFNA